MYGRRVAKMCMGGVAKHFLMVGCQKDLGAAKVF